MGYDRAGMEVERAIDDFGGDYTQFHQLPHDSEAERAVLAAILRDNNKFDEMEFALEKEDFYSRNHAAIFAQVKRLRFEENKAADVVTVVSALKDADQLDLAGGKDYVIELDALADITTNFAEYVQIVRDKSTLRSLMAETEEIRKTVHEPNGAGCAEILDKAERLVFSVSDNYRNNRRDAMRRIAEEIEPIKTRVSELYERIKAGGSPITGLETGFSQLDLMTSGLQKSDLIILAARPSLGKTAFALDLIRNICKASVKKDGQPGTGCALFSLEMSSDQITQRMIGMEGKIDQHRLRTGRLTRSQDWDGFAKAQDEIRRWPMWIDDTAMLNVLELRSRVRRVKRLMDGEGAPLQLVVVDYLQLMESDGGNRDENRVTEVSRISRGLKSLARELKVPVVALSQLSRKIESRTVQRPQLSDLRESGAIEQDADLILFLSRATKPDGPPIGDDQKVDVELIVGKHRNGPTGSIDFFFNKQFTYFEEKPDKSGYDPDDPAPRRADVGEPEDFSFHA